MTPIVMFNALWFEPDGGESRYYEGYGSSALPLLASAGADLMTPFMSVDRALEGGFDPDVVGFVRYPSAEAFDEMWTSDAYAQVAPLRRDAVTRAVLTRCEIDPVDADPVRPPPGVVVLNLLWFLPGGRDRYDDYLAAARPLVEAIGGSLLAPRFVPTAAVEDDVVPELVLLGSYPSLESLTSMVGSPAYAEVAAIRGEAVARSMTTLLRS